MLAITFLTAPVLGVITEEEALKTAEKYSKDSEKAAVYGPYTSQNKSYYYGEYRTGDVLTGVIVIDMGTGKVVSDEKTLRCVLFAVYFLMNVTNESAASSNQKAQQCRAAALHYSNNQNTANIFNNMAETYENIAVIERNISVNLSLSYENAMELSQLYKKLENSLKALNSAYENDMAANANITKQDIERMIEEIETRVQNTQAREDRGVNFANERVEIKKTPGFGLVTAVFALSVIGFVLRKQKK
jgi:hypothetical protein